MYGRLYYKIYYKRKPFDKTPISITVYITSLSLKQTEAENLYIQYKFQGI